MITARRWVETILVRKIERFEVIRNGEAAELTPEELEELLERLRLECYKLRFEDVTDYNGRRYVKVNCLRWE